MKQLVVITGCLFTLSLLIGMTAGATSQKQPSQSNFTPNQRLFIQAENALSSSNYKKFDELFALLDDYPLQEYLRREELIKKLTAGPVSRNLSDQIKKFLIDHNNQPVSRKLRYQWLSYLASNHLVEDFMASYQSSSNIRLKCKNLQFRIEKKQPTEDIFPQVEAIWLTGKSLPKSCDPLIKVWIDAAGLSQHLIWQRMLIAAAQKQYHLVSYLNRKQIKSEQPTGELLIKIMRAPEKLLKLKFKQQISQHGQTIIFEGLNKLAWINPYKAIKAWKLFERRLALNMAQTSKLKRSIGLNLAIKHDAEAKNWLISLSEQDPSIDQWLLSSALTTEDWALIEYITRQKNRKSIDVDKWRYWRAIIIKNKGHRKTSDWLLKSLAKSRSYYGFLAAIDQQLQPDLNINIKVIDNQQLDKISNRKPAKNALEFYQLARFNEARSEWNSLLSQSTNDELVSIAQLAHQWGWQHQTILAFAKSKQTDDIEKRFPFYLEKLYRVESDKHKIPVSWAYAITRQESAFKPDASSSAGAQGLMQLTPSTARKVAKRQAKSNQIGYRRKTQLHTPEINVKLGIAHLKEMLDHYHGHPILATAAYNAGQHRVDMWLKENTISDSILWIEQIPYKETREYVKNVLTYQQIYSQLDHSKDSFLSKLSNYPIPTKSNHYSQMTAN